MNPARRLPAYVLPALLTLAVLPAALATCHETVSCGSLHAVTPAEMDAWAPTYTTTGPGGWFDVKGLVHDGSGDPPAASVPTLAPGATAVLQISLIERPPAPNGVLFDYTVTGGPGAEPWWHDPVGGSLATSTGGGNTSTPDPARVEAVVPFQAPTVVGTYYAPFHVVLDSASGSQTATGSVAYKVGFVLPASLPRTITVTAPPDLGGDTKTPAPAWLAVAAVGVAALVASTRRRG